MKYNKDDFSYTYSANGYMITYKGKNIGGASIMGKSKSRGKARSLDMQMYQESAQRDILGILNGNMATHIKTAIENIDKK